MRLDEQRLHRILVLLPVDRRHERRDLEAEPKQDHAQRGRVGAARPEGRNPHGRAERTVSDSGGRAAERADRIERDIGKARNARPEVYLRELDGQRQRRADEDGSRERGPAGMLPAPREHKAQPERHVEQQIRDNVAASGGLECQGPNEVEKAEIDAPADSERKQRAVQDQNGARAGQQQPPADLSGIRRRRCDSTLHVAHDSQPAEREEDPRARIRGSECRILPFIAERARLFSGLAIEFHDTDICAATLSSSTEAAIGDILPTLAGLTVWAIVSLGLAIWLFVWKEVAA